MNKRALAVAATGIAALTIASPAAYAGDPCDADVNGDNIVDFEDLLEVLADWGPCPGCPTDIDGDDIVGLPDLLQVLSNWLQTCLVVVPEELAGNSLADYPDFTPRAVFNVGETIYVAVDPSSHPGTIGQTGDVYIVADKTAAQWDADPSLTAVAGGPQSVTFPGGSLDANVTALTAAPSGAGGTDPWLAYDMVIDFDGDGELGAGDLIDGYDRVGLHVANPLIALGPLGTTAGTYTGGTWLGQRTWYPASIGSMGQLPLIVISHGNGHNYTWYDYLQSHLASYGYIVMSHQNNTGPGIETASTTTLTNTDYILGNQATIMGGVLNGHIDDSRIMWIGHSRGGEGIARAYDRMVDGTYSPANYDESNVILLSSIAPTDFLGPFSANPHDVDYHLLYGSADGDVSGAPNCDICQSFHLLERATGWRASTYVQGADHNDFNCCGFNDFTGPAGTQIGRTEAQKVTKGMYLAMVKHIIDGEDALKEFLWRQYEALRPVGVAATTIVDNELKEDTGKVVIDDFQSQFSTAVSSSGGSVSFSVSNLTEGILNDNNTSFTHTTTDPMNGMTRGRSNDQTRGQVFEYNSDTFIEWGIIASEQDWTDDVYLSFRACQSTRHPNTVMFLADQIFAVTLRDGGGTSSTVNVSVYGGGAEEPYQRTGSGTGAGWQNEFETIRIRITDFVADGGSLDLGDIAAVRIRFGPSFGQSHGRMGLDDLELTQE
jgi:hypothetical protein